MILKIVLHELQPNKANPSDKQVSFLDLNLSIGNYFVITKVYDTCLRYAFDFNGVTYSFF